MLNGTTLALLAMDQVHQDRNQPGERGQQEKRSGEGHGRVRFSRYRESTSSNGTEVSVKI